MRDRQPIVSVLVPCSLDGVENDGRAMRLHFDSCLAEVGSCIGKKILMRLEEARRKNCGKFRISFEFMCRNRSGRKVK